MENSEEMQVGIILQAAGVWDIKTVTNLVRGR